MSVDERTWVSPLREIERAVQERAKELSIDTGEPAGAERLRRLIDDELRRWSDGFKRGTRPHDVAEPALVAERAWRNLAGYGPLEPLLSDDDVWEIMINAPDAIFVKRHTGASGYHDEVFHDDAHVVRILTKILDDASTSHRKLDPAEGLQDAQLDTGARLHIVHGDVGRDGHLLVNIRKFTGQVFVFGDLATRDRDVPGAPAGTVVDAEGIEVRDVDADGCSELVVTRADGTPTVIDSEVEG